AALATAHQRADLQNQFVAVLGHDLRNPLSAIQTGTKMLQTIGLDQRAIHIVNIIERSGARMAGLIDNVLDFARSRLGTGLPVKLREESDLRGMLDQVVSEIRTAQPDRDIFTDIDVPVAIVCDRARIGQLVSNLLANALTHGEPGGPIDVRARVDQEFELSISNRGAAIAPATLNRLFQPFARGADPSESQGLGLGLYISSQIARAHGGTLEARSDDLETRFTLRMPARALTTAQSAADRRPYGRG
ncbi:MAG: HAMP domain-containing sensor histidine kinase, partial [Vicinamibacterales bacterium]